MSPHAQEVSAYIDFNVSMVPQNLWRVVSTCCSLISLMFTGVTAKLVLVLLRVFRTSLTGRRSPSPGTQYCRKSDWSTSTRQLFSG